MPFLRRSSSPERQRTNLLLLMTDQQRADALGCSGGWVQTPNIDRLAAEGVRFANAYTNAPLCVPARVSLALGRYPHNTEVWKTQHHALDRGARTWMRSVQDAGYTTALFGKTHLHPHSGDLRDREDLVRSWGLDHVDEIAGPRAAARCRSNLTQIWERAGLYEAYQADVRERYANKPWVVRPSPLPLDLYADVYVGRQAASWLRGYRGSDPWCCWVSWGGPHEPWDTPEPYASRYSPADMPPAIPHEDPGTDRPRGVLDNKLARFPPFDPEDIARLRADYAGHVTLIDDQVGEVLRAVEERGELDRTLVVFVSDHGEQNGDHGLLYKGVFLDSSVRVPLIVRLPPGDRPAGAVSQAMVEWMDVGATLVDAAGGKPSPDSLARSLLPAALDPAREHRRYALVELKQELTIVTADYKLALNRSAGEPYLLFDLRADPEERRNLVGLPEYEEIQEALQGELHETVAAAR